MCLPPCHILYQFSKSDDQLDVAMYQRSCDVGLGVPFNWASTALFCHIMAHGAGLKPGKMVWFGSDVHIYKNHISALNEQLEREIRPLPRLVINPDASTSPWDISLDDINLEGYDPHGRVKMDMAV